MVSKVGIVSEVRRLKASEQCMSTNSHELNNIRHFNEFAVGSVHLKKPSVGPKGLIGPPCHGAPGRRRQFDHQIICSIVEPGSKVLDLGCGSGELLVLLRKEKKVKGQGIDLNEPAIFQCVEKGLSVLHMDFDSGLSSFPDQSFDYVILNRSLQETIHVEFVLQEALRVGKKVIVGFPNFAHMSARLQLFFKGKTPVNNALPHLWYNTPNLHFLTTADFENFTTERNIKVLKRYYFSRNSLVRFRPNLFAMSAIYVITRSR